MKKLTIAATALFALSTGAAFAGNADLLAHCEAYQAENGATADCSCIADNASDDVAAELLAASTAADLEAASDAAKEQIAACSA